MKSLLLLLLLTSPVQASKTLSPVEDLTGEDICQMVELEVMEAVKFGVIDEDTALDIVVRCTVNYS